MSTMNPAVLPDGKNIDSGPAPNIDPHVCNKVYGDVNDLDKISRIWLQHVSATLDASQHTVSVHGIDSKSVDLVTPSLCNRALRSLQRKSQPC